MHLKINNRYLAIRGVPFEGKLVTVSLGMANNEVNRVKVEKQIDKIKDALQRQKFDFAAWFPLSTHLQKQREQVAQAAKVAEQRTGTTLREFIARWLENQANKLDIVPETLKSYQSHLAHVTEDAALADKSLTAITEEDVRAFLKRLSMKRGGKQVDASGAETPRTLKASHVNKVVGRLRAVFAFALRTKLDDGTRLLTESPMEFIKNLRQEKPRVDPFSEEEASALIEAVPTERPWFAVYLKIAIYAGLRPSEILALNWNDVDFVRGIIVVSKTTSRSGIRQPKTEHSNREVLMSPEVAETLRKWKLRQAEDVLAGRVLNPNNLLFPSDVGTVFGFQNISAREWEITMRRAKLDGKPVRRRAIYQCRHTFASLSLERNEPIRWLARQMGHGDISMITKVYSRWLPDERPTRPEIATVPNKITA